MDSFQGPRIQLRTKNPTLDEAVEDTIENRETPKNPAIPDDRAIKERLLKLKSADRGQRALSVRELKDCVDDPKVVQALGDQISDETDREISESILGLLAGPHAKAVYQAVAVRMYDSDARIVVAALSTLSRIDPRKTAPLALSFLDSTDPELRIVAIRVAALDHREKAQRSIESMVHHTEAAHRRAALSLIAGSDAYLLDTDSLLRKLANDPDPTVSRQARDACAHRRITQEEPAAVPAVPAVPAKVRSQPMGGLDSLDRGRPMVEAPTGIAYEADMRVLLTEAMTKGSSDLHLGVGYPPIFRIHGAMVPAAGRSFLEKGHLWHLIRQLLPADSVEEFHREGDLDRSVDIPGLARFRVNVLKDIRGPGLVIRVIPSRIKTLTELGSPEILTTLVREARGLLLITGPTGSGKSTTCAAMVDLINETQNAHIITIEDPVEFVHTPKRSRITQREVGANTHSFAKALRAALREDPDVILVGEMRDLETIELAITAAETGHLVLGTLHTSSAPKTVDRIVNVFPADRQDQIRMTLADALLGVVSQSLVRRMASPGRVAAYEIMFRVQAISNLIREGKIFQIPNVMLSHAKQGMRLLDNDLCRLAQEGIISTEDGLALANDKELFRQGAGRLGFGRPPSHG